MKDIHLSDKEFQKMIKQHNKNKKSTKYNIGYYVIGPLVGIALGLLFVLLLVAGIVGLWRFIF